MKKLDIATTQSANQVNTQISAEGEASTQSQMSTESSADAGEQLSANQTSNEL